MLNAFYNPAEAVLDVKKMGDWTTTLSVMAISVILLALSPLLFMKSLVWQMPLVVIGTMVVGIFLGGIFLKIVLSILGADKPHYFEIVTAITYSIAPLSLAVLAGSLIGLIPYLGMALAGLVVMAGGIAMISTQLRAIQELTETDLLTSVVASWFVMSLGAGISSMIFAWSSFMGIAKMLFGMA